MTPPKKKATKKKAAKAKFKKKPPSKLTPKEKPKRVDEAESDDMLKLWIPIRDTGGYKAVARKFKRSVTTVRRVAIKYNWNERALKIGKKRQANTDKLIAKSQMTNARMGMAIRDRTLHAFLSRKDLVNNVTVRDTVAILQYCDDIGVGGEQAADNQAHGNPEALARALEVVKKLGSIGLDALGRWIVKNSKAPEDITADA